MTFNIYVLFLFSVFYIVNSCLVEKNLVASIQKGDTKDIVVTFQGNQAFFNKVNSRACGVGKNHATKVAMITAMKKHCSQQQKVTMEILRNFSGIKVTSMWISNTIHIQGATVEVVNAIHNHSDAALVRQASIATIPKYSTRKTPYQSATAPVAWGVNRVGAPTVWKMGCNGKGVTVATIDTGVHVTHESLKKTFRKSKGWYDYYNRTDTPWDPNGHGTHTMGTICGSNGIGVAPSAKWMSCRGCDAEGICDEVALLACAQFVACPFDPDESNPDCSQIPDIVSNSWISDPRSTFFEDAVTTWRMLGIIPIFSIGNDGPGCGTAGAPANFPNVIAVGSNSQLDGLSNFSSRGSVADGIPMKPDVSAPGEEIFSASSESNSGYMTLSGTSMAGPHVAGVAALLFGCSQTSLTYDQMYLLLTRGADRLQLQDPEVDLCGTESTTVFPNTWYGWGRANATAALHSLIDGTVLL